MQTCKKCSSETENQFENYWKCGEANPSYTPYIKNIKNTPYKRIHITLEGKIKNFKTLGIYVVLLTFVGFPLLYYLIVANSTSPSYGFSFLIYLATVFLWVRLFKELD